MQRDQRLTLSIHDLHCGDMACGGRFVLNFAKLRVAK